MNIKFRPHQIIDIPYRVKWLSDPKITRYLGDEVMKKTTVAKQKKWFEKYKKDKKIIFFTICDNELPIGIVGLTKISKANKNADLFILIGNRKYQRKGVGMLAMQFILNYGFNKLKLHKISLGVFSNNLPAIKLYKKIGFKTEGKFRDECLRRGKYLDMLSMAKFNKI